MDENYFKIVYSWNYQRVFYFSAIIHLFNFRPTCFWDKPHLFGNYYSTHIYGNFRWNLILMYLNLLFYLESDKINNYFLFYFLDKHLINYSTKIHYICNTIGIILILEFFRYMCLWNKKHQKNKILSRFRVHLSSKTQKLKKTSNVIVDTNDFQESKLNLINN